MKNFWNTIKDYVIIIVVVVLIRTFIGTPGIVDGASMNNTLEDGQLVIINKLVYRFDEINRFDIVVINNKIDDERIIKRVIGLPNETIRITDNKLFINDEYVKVDFEFADTNDFEATTKDGEYFVLGDNRIVSKDSRIIGNIKEKDILGRVRFRLFPFSKMGNIDK